MSDDKHQQDLAIQLWEFKSHRWTTLNLDD